MGLMRFVVSPPDRLTEQTAQQAYLSGIDRTPWQLGTRWAGGELLLERAVSDSANLHVPWPVKDHAQMTLSTGSLMERGEPYHLPLELARGKLGQVRNQLSEWEMIGLAVPEDVSKRIAAAMKHFGRAIAVEPDSEASVAAAERALDVAVEAADLLAGAYTEQALAVRRRASQKIDALLGGDLGVTLLDDFTARQFLQTFNAAVVPMVWREIATSEESYRWDICDKQIQWCRANRLAVCAGPLLQLDQRSIPDWLCLWEDDFDSLLSFFSDFVTAAVSRYCGKVDVWQCAGRVNNADILSLSEEDKVRMAARALELTRSLDSTAAVLVSFDQPWAEYMSRRAMDFPPLHFADALIRADLGLSGLMLEINVGYWPGGTMLRGPLEFSRQLDYWSLLGLPLYVTLCAPSASGDDPLAQQRVKLPPGSWTARGQLAWANRYVTLLLSKPYVRGIFWNQLRDCEPHDFPHGGLFDLRRHPKQTLRTLASIRQAHLK